MLKARVRIGSFSSSPRVFCFEKAGKKLEKVESHIFKGQQKIP
jgi:hypothetical protein